MLSGSRRSRNLSRTALGIVTKLKHSSQPGEAGSFTRGGIGYGVRHDKLVFRAGCAKMLRGRHMQDLVSENRPCPGFPQQKSALSTRFPQNLWIKLGKSGKVPKIGVKCRAGRSQSAALMLMCSVSDRTRSDSDGPASSSGALKAHDPASTPELRRRLILAARSPARRSRVSGL